MKGGGYILERFGGDGRASVVGKRRRGDLGAVFVEETIVVGW